MPVAERCAQVAADLPAASEIRSCTSPRPPCGSIAKVSQVVPVYVYVGVLVEVGADKPFTSIKAAIAGAAAGDAIVDVHLLDNVSGEHGAAIQLIGGGAIYDPGLRINASGVWWGARSTRTDGVADSGTFHFGWHFTP